MFHFRGPRSFAKDRNGAVTIEFVVTLPLFLAALAFAFEFGQIFLAHQSTVNNVRAASRYLSRADLSTQTATAISLSRARNIIRTGQVFGGSAPGYLDDICLPVSECIDTSYTTFGPPTFTKAGRTVRLKVRVDYPLSIFGLAGETRASVPFVVVEDARVMDS